ncbi:MAG: helix-turn-helix transcriptional regulator [Candidatus Heimdallarchaeota archaeon]|nr:helix-turn-helix transcriptional regulator [Candidatus Heimdallarchaeota archaeon]
MNPKTIGQIIKRQRKSLYITLAALSEKTDISIAKLSLIENGQNCRLSELATIGEALHMPTFEDLLKAEGEL